MFKNFKVKIYISLLAYFSYFVFYELFKQVLNYCFRGNKNYCIQKNFNARHQTEVKRK